MKMLAVQNIKVQTLSFHRDTILIHSPHVKITFTKIQNTKNNISLALSQRI